MVKIFNKKTNIYIVNYLKINMEVSEFKDSFGKLVWIEDKEHGRYSSFIPSKLPPKLDYNQSLVLSLSKADSTLSKLSGAGLLLPNPNLLIVPYLKKEALSSSRIEGTRISLSDYFLSEAKGITKENIESTEVGNYIRAIKHALKEIDTKPISMELIKKMHKILLKRVRGDEKSGQKAVRAFFPEKIGESERN